MSIKSYFSLSLILLLAVTLTSSCKKEGCTDPEAINFNEEAKKDDGSCRYAPKEGDVRVEFTYVFGSSALPWDINTPLRHPKTGDTLTFTEFAFYVSNVKLKNQDGTWWSEPDSYHLICAKCTDKDFFMLNDVPAGFYNEMEYTLGVDSARNAAGEQSGDLDPSRGMFWDRANGYIMIKAEGQSPQSSDGAFTFHLGGYTSPYSVITPKSFDFGTNAIFVGETTPTVGFTANPARLWHSSAGVSVNSYINEPGGRADTMATDFFSNVSFREIK